MELRLTGLPAEILELLAGLFGCRRPEAAGLTLTGVDVHGKGHPMNPITVGPGATITAAAAPTPALSHFKGPLAWGPVTGVDPAPAPAVSPDTLSATFAFDPAVLNGTATVTATYTRSDATVVTGTLVVNIVEAEATGMVIDATLVLPAPAAAPPA